MRVRVRARAPPHAAHRLVLRAREEQRAAARDGQRAHEAVVALPEVDGGGERVAAWGGV